MKPAFALSFSATGISLYHHSDDEWFVIGSIPLDSPDLSGQMQVLREKAFALENDLSCKLVLPSEQVRYLQVATDDLPPEDTVERIERALADATPYALSELSYDYQTEGGTTYVAAVAQETLSEARTFASDHGFVPVLFCAEEDADAFPREALFTARSGVSKTQPAEPPLSEKNSDLPEPAKSTEKPAHPIAGTAAPNVFLTPETPDKKFANTKAQAPRIAILAFAATVLLGGVFGVWLALDSGGETDQVALSPTPTEIGVSAPDIDALPPTVPEVAAIAPSENLPPEPALDGDVPPTPDPAEAEAVEQPELTPTDAAILEALKVAPTPVESVAQDPEADEDISAASGVNVTPPAALDVPEAPEPDDLYLTSIDKSDLSSDAVALPPASSFDTDEPFVRDVQHGIAGARFNLDDRGLVTPTPEGTLNPDGIVIYQGRPPKIPPATPVRFEDEPVLDEVDERLAGLRPKPRPADLVESFERGQLGGRSLAELSTKRPKARPDSLQARTEIDETPTALAVVRVPRPRLRPAGLDTAKAPVSGNSNLGSTAAMDQSSDDAGSFQPKSVAPKIPSTASVARQATLDNAINLRRLNLIGVYGTPANRRALVRLPSGRYKKLKVGDNIDGGKVIAISDSELRYQKKGRNVTLAMPRS
ncbi:hypothetical protein [Ruegeria sp. HKCCSA071]|uniref:hypothetical protein n=1 Tax=Ruegeria sp. HKCCSA071 TaxID=2794834 RepID=UPI001AE4ACF5|nr:hypothetical protein [Ruegeria sp. HKCCSA071]